MTWLDDDRDELKRRRHSEAELRTRESLIAGEAVTIYDNLWKEIVAVIKEAESKGLPRILTNGSPYARVLVVTGQPIPPSNTVANPKRIVLALANNQQSISASGPDMSITLLLDLGEDNVVGMRHEGESKDPKEAAKLILRPLLFPELFGSV